MIVRFSEKLKASFPNIKVATLEAKDIINKSYDLRLEEKKRVLESYIRMNYRDVENMDAIKRYNRFFRKFGKIYPIQYQIKSIADSERKIPSMSTIVKAMIMAELKNMFLTAGHDLDIIKGDLETRQTDGSETYLKMNNAMQRLESEDIVTIDSEGIISSVLYGPDYRTRITNRTRNCLFFSYFPHGEDDTNIRGHFYDIMENINVFSEGKLVFSNIQIFGK